MERCERFELRLLKKACLHALTSPRTFITVEESMRTRLSSCCVKLRRMVGTSVSSSARCSSISARNAAN